MKMTSLSLISRPLKAETVYNILYASFLSSHRATISETACLPGTIEHTFGSFIDQSDLAYYLSYVEKYDKT